MMQPRRANEKTTPRAARLQAVVFDLDGTLTDSWPPALAAFRAAVGEFADRPLSDEELMAYAGPAEEAIFQQVVPTRWRECFERYLEGYRARLHPGIAFAGIPRLLERLREARVARAVVSGKTQRALEATLEVAGMTGYFAGVQGGSVEGDRKAELLGAMIERLGCVPSSVAYVGDTVGDTRAARAAGAIAVGVSWAPTARAQDIRAERPDAHCASVAEFEAWCLARIGP